MSAPKWVTVENGPWRIRPSAFDGHAAVTHRGDGGSELIASETLSDLALLRDALTEYLAAQGHPEAPR